MTYPDTVSTLSVFSLFLTGPLIPPLLLGAGLCPCCQPDKVESNAGQLSRFWQDQAISHTHTCLSWVEEEAWEPRENPLTQTSLRKTPGPGIKPTTRVAFPPPLGLTVWLFESCVRRRAQSQAGRLFSQTVQPQPGGWPSYPQPVILWNSKPDKPFFCSKLIYLM